MNFKMPNTICLSMSVCLLFIIASSSWAQNPPEVKLVKIEGLKAEYYSCTPVAFGVTNTSTQEAYIEIYAEILESGSWRDVDYPYDLKDPQSLYFKRVLVNPSMLKPGDSIRLTYDRCTKPDFVKETKRAFRGEIIKKDSKTGDSVNQRLRVDVYFRVRGQLKRVGQVWSQPFTRVRPVNGLQR